MDIPIKVFKYRFMDNSMNELIFRQSIAEAYIPGIISFVNDQTIPVAPSVYKGFTFYVPMVDNCIIIFDGSGLTPSQMDFGSPAYVDFGDKKIVIPSFWTETFLEFGTRLFDRVTRAEGIGGIPGSTIDPYEWLSQASVTTFCAWLQGEQTWNWNRFPEIIDFCTCNNCTQDVQPCILLCDSKVKGMVRSAYYTYMWDMAGVFDPVPNKDATHWRFNIAGSGCTPQDVLKWAKDGNLPSEITLTYDPSIIITTHDGFGIWPWSAEDWTFTIIADPNLILNPTPNIWGYAGSRQFSLLYLPQQSSRSHGLAMFHEMNHALGYASDALRSGSSLYGEASGHYEVLFCNYVKNDVRWKDNPNIIQYCKDPKPAALTLDVDEAFYYMLYEAKRPICDSGKIMCDIYNRGHLLKCNSDRYWDDIGVSNECYNKPIFKMEQFGSPTGGVLSKINYDYYFMGLAVGGDIVNAAIRIYLEPESDGWISIKSPGASESSIWYPGWDYITIPDYYLNSYSNNTVQQGDRFGGIFSILFSNDGDYSLLFQTGNIVNGTFISMDGVTNQIHVGSVAPPTPAPICTYGNTKCENGNNYICDVNEKWVTGWVFNGPCATCIERDTRCGTGGRQLICTNNTWVDNGANAGCNNCSPNNVWSYSPLYPKVGELVTFIGTDMCAAGNWFTWRIEDTSGNRIITLGSPKTSYKFTSDGMYKIVLRTQNEVGAWWESYRYIQVGNGGANCQSYPVALFDYFPSSDILINQPVSFTNKSACANNKAIWWGSTGNAYTWHLPDGTISHEFQPSISFSTPGTKHVSLTVENEYGWGEFSSDIIVYSSPQVKPTITGVVILPEICPPGTPFLVRVTIKTGYVKYNGVLTLALKNNSSVIQSVTVTENSIPTLNANYNIDFEFPIGLKVLGQYEFCAEWL